MVYSVRLCVTSVYYYLFEFFAPRDQSMANRLRKLAGGRAEPPASLRRRFASGGNAALCLRGERLYSALKLAK